jgi:hypothetical protein
MCINGAQRVARRWRRQTLQLDVVALRHHRNVCKDRARRTYTLDEREEGDPYGPPSIFLVIFLVISLVISLAIPPVALSSSLSCL